MMLCEYQHSSILTHLAEMPHGPKLSKGKQIKVVGEELPGSYPALGDNNKAGRYQPTVREIPPKEEERFVTTQQLYNTVLRHNPRADFLSCRYLQQKISTGWCHINLGYLGFKGVKDSRLLYGYME